MKRVVRDLSWRLDLFDLGPRLLLAFVEFGTGLTEHLVLLLFDNLVQDVVRFCAAEGTEPALDGAAVVRRHQPLRMDGQNRVFV